MHRSPLALVLCVLTTLPGFSQAQLAAGRPPSFESLTDSQWVRLSSPGTGRQQGRILEHSPAELVVSSQGQALRVPATAIDTLWTRSTSVKTGAIAGALIGVAMGLGLGVLCGESVSDCNTGEAMVLFGGVGLGGGGILGALFGLGIPRWKRQYP